MSPREGPSAASVTGQPFHQSVRRYWSDTRVYGDDGQEQQEEDRHDLVIAALAPLHRNLQVMADAAFADKAQDGRGADIDFKPQKRVAEPVRATCGITPSHIRCDHWHQPTAGPRSLRVGVSRRFREELAKRAAGVQCDGDDSRDRAAAKDVDQHQGDDDFGDRAKRIHRAAEDRDIRRGQRARPRVARSESAIAASAPIRVATAAMLIVSISAGVVVPQKAGQVRAVGPGFGQHFGRKVEDMRQAGPEIAGIAFLGQHPARSHQRDEEDQQDAAIHPLAADHLDIGLAVVREVGALSLFGTEGDIDHGIFGQKGRTPGSEGVRPERVYMPSCSLRAAMTPS